MSKWIKTRLGDLFEFKNGMNAEKAAYGDGIAFVNVMDVFGNDTLTADTIRGKIQANEKQVKDYEVRRGDVLFNRTSETFDEIALSSVYMDDAPVVFGGFVIRARPTTAKLSPHFCIYFFQADAIRREMIRRGQGAVRANIGQKDLATVPARIPPLAEQKRIAEILSTWDRAIETTEKLIANSEAQKKALLQQLLTGKKRLPGFTGEWKEIRLGDALKERIERNPGDLPLLSVSQSEGVIPQEEAGRRNISSTDMSKYKVVRRDDIAYNTMRMWQGASALSKLEGIVSPAYTILTAQNNQCPLFFSYLFKYRPMVHIFERHSQGLVSDTWNLKYPHLSKIKALIPTVKEQAAIANALLDVDRLIASLARSTDQLRSEKSALMQQLLTGKRRVKVDKEVEAA